MVGENSKQLSKEEAALYDRQIRLWGLQSQKRLQAARILVIGMTGLGAEVAKNIALTGVKQLTLMDHEKTSQEDFSSQFLIGHDKLDVNRAEASLARTQQLNPMVQVTAENMKLADAPDTFFGNFDVVCMTSGSKEEIVRVNHICRENGIKFFAGGVYGFFGYSFSDMQEHEYTEEIAVTKPVDATNGTAKDNETTVKVVKRTAAFVPLQDAMDIDWTSDDYSKRLKKVTPCFFLLHVLLKFVSVHGRKPSPKRRQDDLLELQKMRDEELEKLCVPKDKIEDSSLENVFGMVSPTCAVVGGIMAQEIIKAVSQKDVPLNNFFFIDPITMLGTVELLGN